MPVQSFDFESAETISDDAYGTLDKRGSQEPIPSSLEKFLTDAQLESLYHFEDFGWRLVFVRRPLFELATVVMLSPEGKQYAVIDEDGSLNLEPEILMRAS